MKEDGLPSNMCNDCLFTLNLSANFKDQCIKCDNELRHAISSEQSILYKTLTILSDSTMVETIQENQCETVQNSVEYVY